MPNYILKIYLRLHIFSYRRYGKTGGEKTKAFSLIFRSRGCTRCKLCFHVENCQHANQKQPHATIDLRSRHRINPRPTRFVSGKADECTVDGGLKDVRWIRGLGGEKLPAVSYALLPNLKKGLFFAIGEGSRIFVACFLHSSAQMCLYQTPGRRPPPITGRFVNTDQRVGRSP